MDKDRYNSFIKEFFPIIMALAIGISLSIIVRLF